MFLEIVWKVPRIRLEHSLPLCLKPDSSSSAPANSPTEKLHPQHVVHQGGAQKRSRSVYDPAPPLSLPPNPLSSGPFSAPSSSQGSVWNLYGFEIKECPEPEWRCNGQVYIADLGQVGHQVIRVLFKWFQKQVRGSSSTIHVGDPCSIL